MSESFIGEIRMFAGSLAPRGWAFCDGQLLAVSQNDALFSLLGTIYGGDGRTTFGLPDLRGRIPIHQGSGPGLSDRRLGSKGGAETVTLTVNQLPMHQHDWTAVTDIADTTNPASARLATATSSIYQTSVTSDLTQLNEDAMASAGGSQPLSNEMPFLCVNFIISLFGIYPSRT
ncbi:MAG: tail fiber protein [Cyanobacteria bacterium P01_A01_bin.3]